MKLLVITEKADPADKADSYEGESVSFMTEPSGVLYVLEKPSRPWMVYAPGQWLRVQVDHDG